MKKEFLTTNWLSVDFYLQRYLSAQKKGGGGGGVPDTNSDRGKQPISPVMVSGGLGGRIVLPTRTSATADVGLATGRTSA